MVLVPINFIIIIIIIAAIIIKRFDFFNDLINVYKIINFVMLFN